MVERAYIFKEDTRGTKATNLSKFACKFITFHLCGMNNINNRIHVKKGLSTRGRMY